MKKLLIALFLFPIFTYGNAIKIPTTIKEVTVYLSGAQITRTAHIALQSGAHEYLFTGLSPKMDESSIQISGLKSVSVLSIAFDIDYLIPSKNHPMGSELESKIKVINNTIAQLKNRISGLEEEEKVIHTNRLISGENLTLDLDQVKRIGTYYRERVTAIKNEVFELNHEINLLHLDLASFQKQMNEINIVPNKEQGVVRLKLDAPIATVIDLQISYTIQDAGWIPNYDIRSQQLNDPLRLTYKAHVYQKSGVDWENVKINLSSGSPALNVSKPTLGVKYLDFVNRFAKRYENAVKKQKYFYNPMVKKVVGQITDRSGEPLPGVSVVAKGTSQGTTTDFDGNYSLDIRNGQDLVYSYIGYSTSEIPVYSSVMNLQLQEDTQPLDEVVVTAMGTKKTNSIAYAVSSVQLENTLQGSVAGVQIRGMSSLGNTSANKRIPEPIRPLYVIDGVPVVDFVEGDLDEDDIQSIEVLNGANAEVLYGARGQYGIILISTKKSNSKEGAGNTRFEITKPYSIISDGDIISIELNSFDLKAEYEYFAAPLLNGNVFLTATFTDWEQHNLLPGDANVYFEGAYAGKTSIDPYTTTKEMTLSLGIDPDITVTREQNRDYKSRTFTGSNRIVDRTYELVVKNNKSVPVKLKLMDRVPLSQNKEIKVDAIDMGNASYDPKKGLLTWKIPLNPSEGITESFSFKVKYPRHRTISL